MIAWWLVGATLLSVFFFPYPMTAALSLVASLYFPPFALLVGIGIDLLYFVEGGPLPLASGIGGALSLLALFVRHFIKTRIMQ